MKPDTRDVDPQELLPEALRGTWMARACRLFLAGVLLGAAAEESKRLFAACTRNASAPHTDEKQSQGR